MNTVTLLIFIHIFSLSLKYSWSLRCRVNRQQTDDHFQKVFQICKKRYSGYDMDSSGSDSDSSESSSNENLFDKKFFLASKKKYTTGDSGSSRDQNYNWNRANNNKSTQYGSTISTSRSNSNSRDAQQSRYNDRNRHNDQEVMRWNNQRNGNGNARNSDKQREKSCIVQCFFNELNVVDHRGFPERRAVTDLFTQNIRDPELQEFVEESIVECFHFLRSDMRTEKCDFSQNLLKCLADKGRERCDDWDD